MKRFLVCTILMLPLLLQQCSPDRDNPASAADHSKPIQIAIATENGFDTIAASAMYKVSGTGMDTMEGKLDIMYSSISGTIDKVPIGKDRKFEVLVYDFNGQMIYEGFDIVDINGGTTIVTIYLHKVIDGSAQIKGKIESSSDFPPIEIIHNVAQARWDSTVPISQIWFGAGGTSSNHDFTSNPYEYSYSTKGVLADTFVGWHTIGWVGGNFDAPWNGTIEITFSARYRVHPEIMATKVIHVLMENGRPIDLDLPIPPAPQFATDTARFQLGPNDSVSVISLFGDDTMTITATGTWCMSSALCCTADGNTSVDTKQFIEPALTGGALVASIKESKDTVFVVGSSKVIIGPEKLGKYIHFYANKFRPNRNGHESGKIELVIIQKGWQQGAITSKK